MRCWIASHRLIYTLTVAGIILAVVLPVWATGHRPMWPVSICTIGVVSAAAIVLARGPHPRDWLRRHRG